MPGRRTTRQSVLTSPRKSHAPRPSSSHRVSTPQYVIPDDTPSSDLRLRICGIFADAQATTAGHRKLVINLRKIQGECCYAAEPVNGAPAGAQPDEADEERFNEELGRCVVRLMGAKKSEGVGDKVVRFLGLFLKHASEKDNSLLADHVDLDATVLPETPTTRLTTYILNLLLPFLASKDKTVRYRSTQLISHIINNLDSIDDDVFHLLRMGLLKRVRDKEPTVRVQAVLGLGRLAGNETDADPDEDGDSSNDEGGSGLLERLLEVMQNDPSADVRRSLLLNLPLTPSTLPYLLERARDQDAGTRRALYSRLLPALGDFRHLSLSMREKLLRWGLRDRDENVRKAAGKLFRDRWIEDCAGTSRALQTTEGGPVGGGAEAEHAPSFDGLLELLERIDVVNSGVENGVALEAMKGFWEGRPDYRDAVTFDDAFWDGLTAESVFMARSFSDFCRLEPGGLEDLVEEKMPEVTKFAFYLERYTGTLVESLKKAAAAQKEVKDEGDEEDDEEFNVVEQEFIVEQLLHIAATLDYSDEVGRRKTFSLMRETLAIAELPEEVTKLVIEVLRCLCGEERAGEREFCDVVLEAVAEVHDAIDDGDDEVEEEEEEDDSFHSARSELSSDTAVQNSKNKKAKGGKKPKQDFATESAAAIQAIMINMKCLHIASCMLSNIESDLQDNVHLVTMLNNLVVPAVRSHEAPIRERGLLCLGLCCLLDRSLAEENLTLFIHCFAKGHDALQVYALQILSDILTTHGSALLDATALPQESASHTGKAPTHPLLKIFGKALRADDKPDVQAASGTALCKLMLSGVIRDEGLLKTLVVAYFDPSTAGNLALRQALSYFLPVYCHSKRENQERMGRVTLGAIHGLFLIREDVDQDEEMVGLGVVAAQMVEWTDPRRVVVLGGGGLGEEGGMVDESGKLKAAKEVNGDVHLDLGIDVLEKVLGSGCNKEERKPLASIFGKLYITANADREKLRTIQELVTEAVEDKILTDAPSRNSLLKLQAALAKVVVDEEGAAAPEEEGETVQEEDETVMAPRDGEEEETIIEGMRSELAIRPKREPVDLRRDSTLSELLDDDDDEDDTIT